MGDYKNAPSSNARNFSQRGAEIYCVTGSSQSIYPRIYGNAQCQRNMYSTCKAYAPNQLNQFYLFLGFKWRLWNCSEIGTISCNENFLIPHLESKGFVKQNLEVK